MTALTRYDKIEDISKILKTESDVMEIQFAPAAGYKKEIKELFTKAFPREERPPLPFLFRRVKKGKGDFCAVLDGDRFVGLTLVAEAEGVAALMFFAISDSVRGQGYGSRVLQALQAQYAGKKLFLTIEPLDEKAPNYRQRVRRKAFYKRNGFESMGYTVREAGVTYELLSYGGDVTKEEYRAVTEKLFGKLAYSLISRF